MLRNFKELNDLMADAGEKVPNIKSAWNKIKSIIATKIDNDINERMGVINESLSEILIQNIQEVIESDSFSSEAQRNTVILSAASLYLILLTKDEVLVSLGAEDTLELPFED